MTEQDKRRTLADAYVEEIGVTICPGGAAGGAFVDWEDERLKRSMGDGNRQYLPAISMRS
jgi:hypothetical protein